MGTALCRVEHREQQLFGTGHQLHSQTPQHFHESSSYSEDEQTVNSDSFSSLGTSDPKAGDKLSFHQQNSHVEFALQTKQWIFFSELLRYSSPALQEKQL